MVQWIIINSSRICLGDNQGVTTGIKRCNGRNSFLIWKTSTYHTFAMHPE